MQILSSTIIDSIIKEFVMVMKIAKSSLWFIYENFSIGGGAEQSPY